MGVQEEILQVGSGNTPGISSMKATTPIRVFPQTPQSVLVKWVAHPRPQPPAHPGMQALRWGANCAWRRTNERLPAPLCLEN